MVRNVFVEADGASIGLRGTTGGRKGEGCPKGVAAAILSSNKIRGGFEIEITKFVRTAYGGGKLFGTPSRPQTDP